MKGHLRVVYMRSVLTSVLSPASKAFEAMRASNSEPTEASAEFRRSQPPASINGDDVAAFKAGLNRHKVFWANLLTTIPNNFEAFEPAIYAIGDGVHLPDHLVTVLENPLSRLPTEVDIVAQVLSEIVQLHQIC